MKKTLKPFRGWVLENFPFIETDFDALTNYQLISKIVEYINYIAADLVEVENNYNTLIEIVNELQEYVVDLQEDTTQIKADIESIRNSLENYYTKEETYNKDEVNSLIPDLTDYYTKEQVNALIPDLTDYATKEYVNSIVGDINNAIDLINGEVI